MARPLRIEYPGACYHVINRGNMRLLPEAILELRSPHAEARRILMYLSCHDARHATTLTKLAKAFWVSVSGLTRGRDRVQESVSKDKHLRRRLKSIE